MQEIKLTENQVEELLRSIIGDQLVDDLITKFEDEEETSEEVCEDCGYSTCICDQLEEAEISQTDKFKAYMHNFMDEVLSGKIVLENCQEQLALQHVIFAMESDVSA